MIPFPDMRRINEEMAAHNPRDFEQAIDDADDDRVDNSHLQIPGTDWQERHPSSGNTRERRRMTVRLGKHDKTDGSIKSASSSRSTSPPNSVDAFADPRVVRARAGTINSRAGSDTDNEGHHAQSFGGTHTRRPTFTGGSVARDTNKDDDGHSHINNEESEDDVCMPPPEEWTKTLPIDFEALEEFIAEKNAPVNRSRSGTASSDRSWRGRRDSVQAKANAPMLGGIPALKKNDRDDSSSSMDEKAAAQGQTSSSNANPGLGAKRFTFFSSEQESMIHASEIENLITPDITFRDLFELPEQGGVWWLDCVNPNHDEIEAITKAFYVHPLTKEDILMQESREKVELFQKYYFTSFRSFHQVDKTSDDYLDPVNVYIVVFRTGVLSFSFAPVPHATNVLRRIGRLRDYVALSSDWICYAMM
jgi:magnesium transporter